MTEPLTIADLEAARDLSENDAAEFRRRIFRPRRVIAEIGSCNGDLGLAVETAVAAIESGAWMVKGQMYRAETLVTRDAPSYGKDSIVEKATQFEAFEKALSYDDWKTVADAVRGRFFASVFDLEACVDYPYSWIKVASADITYRDLVEEAAATGKNLILSTGAANTLEVHRALKWIEPVVPTLLACTLSYPTEPSDANVRKVHSLRSFHVPVGYSDHTRGIQASALAFEFGATMVEKHFTIVPGTGGDHDFAITPAELEILVENRTPPSDAIVAIYGGSPILGAHLPERQARQYARRSLRAAVEIPAGTVVTKEMVDVLRPGDGLDPWYLHETAGPLGRHASRNLRIGDPITAADFLR